MFEQLDSICGAMLGKVHRPKGIVISVLVHSLFLDEGETESAQIDPQQAVTLGDLEACIKEFLQMGFEFIAPGGSHDDLSDRSRYVWLTFDDGYWNNLRVLPLLERYKIPATFYIASGFVKSGQSFWWDVVYREMRARGSGDAAQKVQEKLKSKNSNEVRNILMERFGRDCLAPKQDIARPMTPDELRMFARNPWVRIGNHTRDHEILGNCSLSEAERQIRACQEDLTQMLGEAPKVFAYPSGSVLQGMTQVLQNSGLQLAITTAPGKNPVKSLEHAGSRYMLKRYILWGKRDVARQVRSFAAAVRPSDAAHSIRNRLFHARSR
jgi:peptidoglycan/xylan/chitin deacetylase (PgdA/CDA1 family)